MKTENNRGRRGEGWAVVKKIIELAKTEVISVPSEQRKRVLERARMEMTVWRRDPQHSEVAAQPPAARRPARTGLGRNVLPRRASAATT